MGTLKNKAKVQFKLTGTTRSVISNETELTKLLDLTVVKSQLPVIAFVGDSVLFTIIVTNPNITTSATQVIVTDDLSTQGYLYKADTLKINGVATAGSPQTGVPIATIAGLGVVTVEFEAIVQ